MRSYLPARCALASQSTLGVRSGADLRVLSEVDVLLRQDAAGALLELACDGGVHLRVREPGSGELRWDRRIDQPNANFVGDLDGDGREEVALGDVWVEDQRGRRVGAVSLLDGASGRLLWTVLGVEHRADFGRDVAPAGDWDGDGRADLATVEDHHLLVLAGADGRLLERAEVVGPEHEVWGVEAVGDLDGDDRTDFRLRLHDEHSRRSRVVTGSLAWRALDLGGGWETSWTASGAFAGPSTAADLDGDGRDELLVGRTDPRTAERRLSSYDSTGLEDLRALAPDEPAWKHAGQAAVGRLRPGEPWVVLLPVAAEVDRFGRVARGALAVVPGR